MMKKNNKSVKKNKLEDIHLCEYKSSIQASFRDIEVTGKGRSKELIPGTIIEIWKHQCISCGSVCFSVATHSGPPVRTGQVTLTTGEVLNVVTPAKTRSSVLNVEEGSMAHKMSKLIKEEKDVKPVARANFSNKKIARKIAVKPVVRKNPSSKKVVLQGNKKIARKIAVKPVIRKNPLNKRVGTKAETSDWLEKVTSSKRVGIRKTAKKIAVKKKVTGPYAKAMKKLAK